VEDGFINMSDSELETIWRDRSNSKYSKAYIESVHQEILNRNLSLSSTAVLTNKSKWTKAFGMGCAFWFLYIGCRDSVVFFYPAHNAESFFYQDWLITCFRLPLFLAIIILARKTYSLHELGFRKGPLLVPVMVGVLIISVKFINLFTLGSIQSNLNYFISGLTINLLIAVSEEISFRGFFYNCLLKIKNRNWAEYGGSFLFVLMHFYYLPLTDLPSVFIIGLTFAKLRSKGTSLVILITFHWIEDLFLFIHSKKPLNNAMILLDTILYLIPLGVAIYWKGNEKIDDPTDANALLAKLK